MHAIRGIVTSIWLWILIKLSDRFSGNKKYRIHNKFLMVRKNSNVFDKSDGFICGRIFFISYVAELSGEQPFLDMDRVRFASSIICINSGQR